MGLTQVTLASDLQPLDTGMSASLGGSQLSSERSMENDEAPFPRGNLTSCSTSHAPESGLLKPGYGVSMAVGKEGLGF